MPLSSCLSFSLGCLPSTVQFPFFLYLYAISLLLKLEVTIFVFTENFLESTVDAVDGGMFSGCYAAEISIRGCDSGDCCDGLLFSLGGFGDSAGFWP
jgi:hypothetical protein